MAGVEDEGGAEAEEGEGGGGRNQQKRCVELDPETRFALRAALVPVDRAAVTWSLPPSFSAISGLTSSIGSSPSRPLSFPTCCRLSGGRVKRRGRSHRGRGTCASHPPQEAARCWSLSFL
mmetsp:Transcript_57153/g.170377  ORF Transcript_57153/g.170377 Transcript_57153/m.170377 type:complete len:120 (-) Transcript_57153:1845-2204(-)